MIVALEGTGRRDESRRGTPRACATSAGWQYLWSLRLSARQGNHGYFFFL
jgi:hypothetical protein